MDFRALTAALLILVAPAAASEFKIPPPTEIARMTMPCWPGAQLSAALTVAQFEPVVRGLIVERTDPSRPLVTVWMQLLTGRSAISITHPTGEECLLVALSDAE